MRFIAAELIREQVFRQTHQEVPYSTAVTVDEYKEGEDLVRISATIHVERGPPERHHHRQKGIAAQNHRHRGPARHRGVDRDAGVSGTVR